MSRRPRDIVPVPRYWVMVMDARLMLAVVVKVNRREGRNYSLFGLRCGLAIEWSAGHHLCRCVVSRTGESCKNTCEGLYEDVGLTIGPRFGATCARIPLLFSSVTLVNVATTLKDKDDILR